MHNKFKEIYSKINDHFDIYEIGKVISEFILKEFKAEACEIKCLGEDGIFFRIHIALRKKNEIIHDQDEIEKLFGIKKTPFECSLIGNCVHKKENFYWVGEQETFQKWLNSTKKPVEKNSAQKYLTNMPSGNINNFAVLPLHVLEGKQLRESHKLRGCFHIFNFHNGSTNKIKIEKGINELLDMFYYITLILFNAIDYKRTNDEIEIDRKIDKITSSGKNIEEVLEKTVSEFTKRLNAPLSTVWFPDEGNKVLVLHSYHIQTESLDSKNQESHLRSLIDGCAPKLLKFDDSVSGQLVGDNTKYWLKFLNIEKEAPPRYKWKNIIDEIKTLQFIALPIRHANSTIAIIVLHPKLRERDFHRIPYYYFKSYSTQISTTLKFFMEKNFAEKARTLSEKLTRIVSKREDIFYNELVVKIMEVIDAEACSIFEARGGDNSERGIFLLATTDKRTEAKKRIGKKIYDIDSKSITGHVAKTGRSIIVYDVNEVNLVLDEIFHKSENFLEETIRPHKSYIAVPMPAGSQNFEDKLTSVLIIRCINKKADPNRTLTEMFSLDDKALLIYVGAILESFRKVLEVLHERDALLDLIIHEIENPVVAIRGKIGDIKEKRKRNQLTRTRLDQKLDDIGIMADLLTGWMSNMDFLNQLMQEKEPPIHREKSLLWREIIEDTIYWMSPNLKIYGLSGNDIKRENINFSIKVNADKDHLKQVFYNLIMNALKYKEPGETPDISIEFVEKMEALAIRVKDKGIGVEQSEQEKIFNRGFRSHIAKSSNIKGKGFGLWLCKELMQINDISIRVSYVKSPTIFEVLIPSKYVEYN